MVHCISTLNNNTLHNSTLHNKPAKSAPSNIGSAVSGGGSEQVKSPVRTEPPSIRAAVSRLKCIRRDARGKLSRCSAADVCGVMQEPGVLVTG
jgi:hypothetical protein